MNVIIVESPTKARTLSKFLKKDYAVVATMGHIRDLPKAALGVDIDNNFSPKYVIPRDRKKIVKQLKDEIKKGDSIVLATDPDREGEAIAWHVQSILTDKKSKKRIPANLFKRIVFHEITESAVTHALKEPRKVNGQLVDAQQARRVLDRLVGYKLSPLLWKKLSKRWLSAGRVQSVAVRLIVEREREIRAFQTKKFYTIHGLFKSENAKLESIQAELVSHNNKKYKVTATHDLFDGSYTTTSSTIETDTQAKQIIEDLKKPFSVSSVGKRKITRNPQAPYTTSTLQQDASRRLYFSAKKTMQLAQRLYEHGLITYHRTDSVSLASKFVDEARSYIKKTHGTQYVPDQPKAYKTKSKVAQEAHEAIRPTDVARTIEELPRRKSGTPSTSGLHRDHARLYDLIWKRALASQAKPAIFDSTTLVIASSNDYVFEAQGSVLVFDGFLKITGRNGDETIIPDVKEGEELTLGDIESTEHETKPPPRYSEARLVKTLEEKAIGRPSTYAPTVSTIQDRQYVIKEDKVLKPTSLGEQVNDFLVKYFPDILDLPFTAQLEGKLDAIATGDEKWAPVVEAFYTPFAKTLEETYEKAEKVKAAEEKLDELCPECGETLVLRIGRYGKFVACSAFPDCKYTRQHAEKIDTPCPKCKGDIVIKRTRSKKTFYGCSNYPKCTFAAWKKEDIK